MTSAATVITTDPAGEFNALLTRALGMVTRLSTGSGAGTITMGTYIKETFDFQTAWNASRGLVADELDYLVQENTGDDFFQPAPQSITAEVFEIGLDDDGKFGPRTAIALAMTMWARLGTWEDATGGIPSTLLLIPNSPQTWPEVWASNQSFWTGALAQVIAQPVMPAAPPAPVPQPVMPIVEPSLPPVIDPTPAPPPSPPVMPEAPALPVPVTPPPVFPGPPMPPVMPPAPPPAPGDPIFRDDELVYGQTKGQKSNAPLIVMGLAIFVGGSVIAYTAYKKKKRR